MNNVVANTGYTSTGLQPRRFSERTTANMRGRAELTTPRTGLNKRMYGDNSKTTELNVNEQFVRACENGDYSTVHRILLENEKYNIDVANQLGRTAIQLAIENEHLEVVTLLLYSCDGQKIREAILLAIYLGHIQIAEACLHHPTFRRLNDKRAITDSEGTFWQTPTSDDTQFASDITPLMLAAQHNRTEIVQLLLSQGDRITKPHDYHCKCIECRNRFKFDSLRHAQSRLNAYRGLASESYISLASIDPILTAFELGRELRDLSGKEKYFKNEYMLLADQLSAYAVKLLDKVRGHKELDCVLGKTGKESEEKYVILARLYLAIKYKEKSFVAHSNCQQKLVEIWHSQIRNIFKLNPLLILLLTISYIFILPFACVIYILTSWSIYTIKFQRFLKQPCIKFIGHTITYAVFIVLIIVSSFLFASESKKDLVQLKNISTLSDTLNKALEDQKTNNYSNSTCRIYPVPNFVFRADKPTWIDITISVFVFGFLWREIKQAYNDGLQDYLLSWNNIVDSCTTILYISSFALKYYVIFQVKESRKILDNENFQGDVGRLCDLSKTAQEDIYRTFYWLNADRYYWVPFDPINVAEGLFAIANILSFARICFLLPAFQHLGPLQISLGRMMSDIGKFIIIFLIIFCGFMFGLNNLFWYYKKSVREKVEIYRHLPESGDENENLPAEESFGTMSSTFKTVFWSLFGLAEKEGVQLNHYNKRFTETVGYLIYGAFNIANVIVLLNMLIAMMSKSYEAIEEHADVEWKFARSKLYMEFIKDGGTLPVPFNIVPTPKSIYRLFCNIYAWMTKSKDPTNEQPVESGHSPSAIRPTPRANRRQSTNGNGLTTVSNGQLSNVPNNHRARQGSFFDQVLTYRKVMDRVIKRFLLHKQREEQEEIREGDFEELKQDVQMLRFELLNRLDSTREDLYKNSHLLNEGVLLVGELLSVLSNDTNPLIKENFHLFKKSFYATTDSGIQSNSSTLSTLSMPNLTLPVQTSALISNSNSAPNLYQEESDIDPIDTVRSLTAVHARLSNIKEEEEEYLHNTLKYIDDDEEEEEEVEAQHMSVQTTEDDNQRFFSKL
ncbi:unnamed protein product [Adineta steineri]|uniref:Transient receptor ion channel domain-containing protein n=1 Tax=Adineta steineri TaxID=433720 RepID=A0A815D213_9BILA|nr:unnamed protein product [Adineta steineri]CAF3555970.1 unnamed protein product [Adineta steineri]